MTSATVSEHETHARGSLLPLSYWTSPCYCLLPKCCIIQVPDMPTTLLSLINECCSTCPQLLSFLWVLGAYDRSIQVVAVQPTQQIRKLASDGHLTGRTHLILLQVPVNLHIILQQYCHIHVLSFKYILNKVNWFHRQSLSHYKWTCLHFSGWQLFVTHQSFRVGFFISSSQFSYSANCGGSSLAI